jgi:hypothetical protein
MDDFTKSIKDSILSLPPLFRYSTLVTLAQVIAEELPNAEQAFEEERTAILKNFFEIVLTKDDCK